MLESQILLKLNHQGSLTEESFISLHSDTCFGSLSFEKILKKIDRGSYVCLEDRRVLLCSADQSAWS